MTKGHLRRGTGGGTRDTEEASATVRARGDEDRGRAFGGEGTARR